MSSDGFYLNGDKARTLPDPIPAPNDVIPDKDSVPLSVLNHPIGNRHEIDFAAYGFATSAVPPPGDGPSLV